MSSFEVVQLPVVTASVTKNECIWIFAPRSIHSWSFLAFFLKVLEF